jgi:hypothetical protein
VLDAGPRIFGVEQDCRVVYEQTSYAICDKVSALLAHILIQFDPEHQLGNTVRPLISIFQLGHILPRFLANEIHMVCQKRFELIL